MRQSYINTVLHCNTSKYTKLHCTMSKYTEGPRTWQGHVMASNILLTEAPYRAWQNMNFLLAFLCLGFCLQVFRSSIEYSMKLMKISSQAFSSQCFLHPQPGGAGCWMGVQGPAYQLTEI